MGQKTEFDLKIKGMTCDSCALHVTEALKSVSGVSRAEVPGWKSGQAIVVTEEGTGNTELVNAVRDAGYKATVEKRIDIRSNDRRPDLMVIGGGSAGFAAAIKAVELGFKAALVEGSTMGGTCVNIGCVPSKTLIRSLEQYHQAGNSPFRGVRTASKHLDWSEVVTQKDELVADLRKAKYEDVLAAYPDVEYVSGFAQLKADGSVEIEGQMYSPRKILIATGAKPWAPLIPGLKESAYLTSTTAMDLKKLPKSMILLGANAVGLELAQVFARAGVEITVLEMMPQIAPGTDAEISSALQGYLEQEGLHIITGFKTTEVSRQRGQYILRGRQGEKDTVFQAEQLLVATGRRPATSGFGLEEAGVELGSRGEILVNEVMQTSNPNIYAAGDVIGRDQFVYIAAYGAGLAVENALNGTGRVYETEYIPRVIFSDPQVATAGLTEEQAREQGYDTAVSVLPMEHVPRALAARDTRGLVKLVADRKTDLLLGAHILAPLAGEMIQVAVLALRFGLKVSDLRETIFPYLTDVEAVKLAVLSFDKDVSKLSCCAG